jgi:hypothetical protein
MNSANTTVTSTTAYRGHVKEACLKILSDLEDTMMSTYEITDLIKSEFAKEPWLQHVNAHLVGAVLFQIASNKAGRYEHIKNPSKGFYVYTERPLPTRTDVKTYLPHRGKRGTVTKAPAVKREPRIAVPVSKPQTSVSGAPHFSFIGRVGGQVLVKDDKDNLYVLRPVEIS